uniref:Uncharacterized protein n=1 Tax=Vespula pensylvanica TaxID=30213 RepID=A0A834PDR9_VESPE|nr:hypothetical protein H0235_000208 [Vespula pensylvanica]
MLSPSDHPVSATTTYGPTVTSSYKYSNDDDDDDDDDDDNRGRGSSKKEITFAKSKNFTFGLFSRSHRIFHETLIEHKCERAVHSVYNIPQLVIIPERSQDRAHLFNDLYFLPWLGDNVVDPFPGRRVTMSTVKVNCSS